MYCYYYPFIITLVDYNMDYASHKKVVGHKNQGPAIQNSKRGVNKTKTDLFNHRKTQDQQ